jgi:hypothetical protein
MLKMEMVLQKMMSMNVVLSMKEWILCNLNPLLSAEGRAPLSPLPLPGEKRWHTKGPNAPPTVWGPLASRLSPVVFVFASNYMA